MSAALAGALALTGGMAALGQFGVRRLWPFLIGFALLWLLVLASGVHADHSRRTGSADHPAWQGRS